MRCKKTPLRHIHSRADELVWLPSRARAAKIAVGERFAVAEATARAFGEASLRVAPREPIARPRLHELSDTMEKYEKVEKVGEGTYGARAASEAAF